MAQNADSGARLKQFEAYSSLRILPEIPFALRLDGRCFTSLTEKMQYEHPYDSKFKDAMVATARGMMEEFGAKVAYLQSDEISLLFGKRFDLFHREVEKIDSITASYAGSCFTQTAAIKDQIATFDSRIIVLPQDELIIDYFHWRHVDAVRNALNSWSYWTLRQKEGLDVREATSQLAGKTAAQKNELLFQYSINFNDIPLWQKRGVILKVEEFTKDGADPRKEEQKSGMRRRITLDEQLPTGEEFRSYIRSLLPLLK